MSGNPNPSPATRFPKGYKGGGKPKGATLKPITRRVNAKLDEMLGQAHRNIKKSLKAEDVRVSMWLVDRVAKDRGTSVEKGLLEPLVNALETLDDVEVISRRALLMAMDGDMSFEQLQAVQEALARHSVLAGVIELRQLRDEVDKLAQDNKPATQLGNGHIPNWGKLKTINPEAESDDAPASE